MRNSEKRINTKIFEKVVFTIQQYYLGRDIHYMFLHGGCYWFAATLRKYIPGSDIVFNRKIQHCACLFNHGIYDIRGRIMNEGFCIATAKDIDYMRKHFVPGFDTEAIENHLAIVMNER